MKPKLGQLLVKTGILTPSQLEQVLAYQRRQAQPIKLGEAVVALGLAQEADMLQLLARALQVHFIALEKQEAPNAEALAALPRREAEKRCIVPLRWEYATGSRRLVVATADPFNLAALDELQFVVGGPVRPVLAMRQRINAAIAQHYGGAKPTATPLPATPGRRKAGTKDDTDGATLVGRQSASAPPGPTRAVKLACSVVGGPAKGKTFDIPSGGAAVIGRGASADVVIEDPKMSREHFRIETGPTGPVLRDLGSSNGTYLNKIPVGRRELTDGDTIIAGTSHIHILFE